VISAAATLQMRERDVELAEVVLLAAPVERLVADDALQRLRRHRALHRVPAEMHAPGAATWQTSSNASTTPGRVAEIPRSAVAAAIDVARRARNVTEARREIRIEEELASRAHGRRALHRGRSSAQLRSRPPVGTALTEPSKRLSV
jgi:hypothetical protein